jgi:diadenosine tetraphosphate (Ap4A) HIT family hydrolase
MKTTDFLGNEWEFNCMGCAISNRAMLVPGGFIQHTRNLVLHQDPLIPLPGFLVIASCRHIQSIIDMTDTEYQELSRLIRSAPRAIKEVTRIEFLTLVQEENSMHFHLWFFPWAREVIHRYGQPALTKIREILADYRKGPLDQAEWKKLELSIEQIKARMAE